jgi:hypothetical protein
LKYLFLAFTGFTFSLFGQDTHYWTQQPSVKGISLGGTLAYGEYENSAVFYNPAALAFVDKSHLSANADAYRFESLCLKDGGGKNIDLFSRRLTLYPQMAGAMISHKPENKLKAAFMVLTRQSANWDVNNNTRSRYDVLPQHEGEEDYLASVSYQNAINETWVGTGLGYKFNKNWSCGWSTFISYRNQRYLFNISTRAAYQADSIFISAFSSTDEIRLNNVKNINKLALHGSWEKVKIGFVATLPSIDIAGWTKIKREISFQNLEGNTNGVLYAQQQFVNTNFKMPLSLVLAGKYYQPKWGISFAMEYFFPIRLYKMITADSVQPFFPSSISAEKRDFLSYYHFANGVLNAGLGFSTQLNQKAVLNIGIRSDVSYFRRPPSYRPNSKPILLSPNFDLFHLSSGLIWKRNNSELGLALNYSYAYRKKARQLVNFSEPSDNQFLQGNKQAAASVQSQSFSFVLGYTYFFAMR